MSQVGRDIHIDTWVSPSLGEVKSGRDKREKHILLGREVRERRTEGVGQFVLLFARRLICISPLAQECSRRPRSRRRKCMWTMRESKNRLA